MVENINLEKVLFQYYKETTIISDLEEKKENINYKSLTESEILNLEKLISSLPFELEIILKGKLLYNQSPKDIEEIFSIENPREKYKLVHKKLSKDLSLKDNLLIDIPSLEKACRLSDNKQEKNYKVTIKENQSYQPSKALTKKLNKLGIKYKKSYKNLLTKAAIFFLLVTASLTIFFTYPSQAREKFFDWIIKDFGLYSVFTPENIEDYNVEKVEINDLKVNYIPDGFKLKEIQKGRISTIYIYVKENKFISIDFSDLSKMPSGTLFDSEDINYENIYINKGKAYYWKKNDISTIIWQQNGIECFIVGNINKEELTKIAENISK